MSKSRILRAASLILAILMLLFVAACTPAASSDSTARPTPAPRADAPLATEPGTAKAVLAGGCFWGLQWVFEHVPGVLNVTSGYSGGAAATAHYDRVSEGDTGHAETVKITYDPSKISYGQLLRVYFTAATDPTELNRQGPDTAAHVYARPIVTHVVPFKAFYPAEDYHQDYARLHPDALYIAINDAPKLIALQRELPHLYRAQPVIWHDSDPTTIMVDVH